VTRSSRYRVALVTVALALAGCAGSPPSSFYTLSATAVATAPASAPSYGVSVGPVILPDTVDRPQLVLQLSANQIAIDEFHRWAEPLASGLAQAVAEDLRRLLGTGQVVAAPAATGKTPEYRVTLNVLRFESELGDRAAIDVLWTINDASGNALRSGRTRVSEPAGSGYDALVAAHSKALARLAEDVAAALRSLAGG
jgi:uncharacterized lipoprotein YmbA